MSDAASDETMRATREKIERRLQNGCFGVALSGGGHRATLMTLGALIALVDRGLNPRVLQIASVSGGSITNAFVAQRCDFDALDPGGLDNVAAELAGKVVRQGVLTGPWLAAIFGFAGACGTIAGLLTALVAPSLAAVVIGVLVASATLMGTGRLIQVLLDRRYLRPSCEYERPRGQARLGSLPKRQVDHVFCMTDLVLGLPVLVSMQHGGMMWRRLEPEPDELDEPVTMQTIDISNRTLAEFLRASAAFPGIPPLRFRMPPDPETHRTAAVPRLAFLADGGIWNNLGTQVAREDGFLGENAAWSRGTLRPITPRPTAKMPLMIVNGSAPIRPSRPSFYQFPGLALLYALAQSTRVLNTNTVVPRERSMRRAFARRVWTGSPPDQRWYYDPVDLVVDLTTPKTIARRYSFGYTEEIIRETDTTIKEWEQRVVDGARMAIEHGSWEYLHSLLEEYPKPEGSYPVVGFANIDDYDAVINSRVWKLIAEQEEAAGPICTPTTLGRVDSSAARHIITRGYANTYLASLYLAPLHSQDLHWLERFPDRLTKIVPR
jgi:predicted acylesterase/phospholipase RssA